MFRNLILMSAAIFISLAYQQAEAQSYVVRPNNAFGQPDMFARGQVLTPQSNGTIVVKPEGIIGGQPDMFSRGQVITPQNNGGYKVQKEGLIGGQPDMFDPGYTMYPSR